MRTPPAALRKFLGAYDPEIARLFLATRASLLTAAPDADELIYDAYNAVAAAYTFSNRLKEAFCHVAAYRSYVNLGFNRGASLPDPGGILVGSGRSIRHVRISALADLKQPAIRKLIRAAVAEGRALPNVTAASRRSVVLGAYAKKKRPLKQGSESRKMSSAAKAWHRDHRMPRNASMEQRIAWHVEHAKRCGCRPMPATVAAALGKKRKPAKRKSIPAIPLC